MLVTEGSVARAARPRRGGETRLASDHEVVALLQAEWRRECGDPLSVAWVPLLPVAVEIPRGAQRALPKILLGRGSVSALVKRQLPLKRLRRHQRMDGVPSHAGLMHLSSRGDRCTIAPEKFSPLRLLLPASAMAGREDRNAVV